MDRSRTVVRRTTVAANRDCDPCLSRGRHFLHTRAVLVAVQLPSFTASRRRAHPDVVGGHGFFLGRNKPIRRRRAVCSLQAR